VCGESWVDTRRPVDLTFDGLRVRVMSLGSYSLGSAPLGGAPDWHFEFDLTVSTPSIISVVSFVDERLISELYNDPAQLKTIDRHRFEQLIAQLFHGFGYDVELTKRTRDGGKDIIAISRRDFESKYLIQCKRPEPGNAVAVTTVRELYGIKVDDQATKGIIVTTTHLTKDAREFIEKHRWELEGKEYDDIVDWLRQYQEKHGF
jgi:restriction endonuclease Mrr